eukprot:9842202-Prorocentrum_lima.AAC.1
MEYGKGKPHALTNMSKKHNFCLCQSPSPVPHCRQLNRAPSSPQPRPGILQPKPTSPKPHSSTPSRS